MTIARFARRTTAFANQGFISESRKKKRKAEQLGRRPYERVRAHCICVKVSDAMFFSRQRRRRKSLAQEAVRKLRWARFLRPGFEVLEDRTVFAADTAALLGPGPAHPGAAVARAADGAGLDDEPAQHGPD